MRPKLPPRPCSIEGCTRSARTRGWCPAHYFRFWKNGDPLAGRPSPGLSLRERLDAYSVEQPSGCVEWTGYHRGDGYGQLRVGDRTIRAHRISYELSNGPIPEDLEIDHLCHNRACINPDHLRAVTRSVNQHNRAGAPVSNRSTGVLGVTKRGTRYSAHVKVNKVDYWLGTFDTVEEAHVVVERKRAALLAAVGGSDE